MEVNQDQTLARKIPGKSPKSEIRHNSGEVRLRFPLFIRPANIRWSVEDFLIKKRRAQSGKEKNEILAISIGSVVFCRRIRFIYRIAGK